MMKSVMQSGFRKFNLFRKFQPSKILADVSHVTQCFAFPHSNKNLV